ncbi:MAG: nuclear transport factor 2 family protein [Bacteroidota bacterium]
MRALIITIFSFCLGGLYAQSGTLLSVFDPLIGKTWKAEGRWGDGSVFKQEITFRYGLDKQVVYADAQGFVDEQRTQWGKRNHGIRRWDAQDQVIKFWEFDVFGGLTEGRVFSQGDSIYYQYNYGEGDQQSLVTDAWEKIDDQTYAFKVGQYENGVWKQVYLDTRFIAAPTFTGSEEDFEQIMKNIAAFSASYMNGDYQAIVDAYTPQGKIMPNGPRILQGPEALTRYWKPREGYTTLHHKIRPVAIHILGDTAYDYGYYEGSTKNPEGQVSNWQGKYVIIWKKIAEKWLIDIDIWNRVNP